MSTESLILLWIIDTMEFRDVATTDIPGAFPQTDYYKWDIHINIEGGIVTLLEGIEPPY